MEVEIFPYSISESIRLWGEPTVEDIGAFSIIVSLLDQAGIQIQEDFTIAKFLNKPPVPNPSSITASFEDSYNEDFPKKWINFFSASDEETSSNELIWSIVSSPLHGIARITENGTEALYYPVRTIREMIFSLLVSWIVVLTIQS